VAAATAAAVSAAAAAAAVAAAAVAAAVAAVAMVLLQSAGGLPCHGAATCVQVTAAESSAEYLEFWRKFNPFAAGTSSPLVWSFFSLHANHHAKLFIIQTRNEPEMAAQGNCDGHLPEITI